MPTVCQTNGTCKMHVDSTFMGLRAHSLLGGKHVSRQCFEVCSQQGDWGCDSTKGQGRLPEGDIKLILDG